MLPLSLLRTAQGHPMLVELKNGETYNGHLVNCDTWMNIHLREVICTSKVTEKVQEEKRIDRKPPITGRGRGIGRGDKPGGRGPSKGGGQGYQEDGVSRGGGCGKGTGRGAIGKRGWPWPYVRAAYFIAEWKQFLTNHFTRFSCIWKVACKTRPMLHRIYWPSGFVETL